MVRICCPVGFSEEIIAVFEKKSQIDTENDKNPKTFQFLIKFMHFLSNF